MEQEPIAPGQIIADRYRVERILGRGGMGVVAAARHVALDETFAVKVLTPEAFENAASVERFVREARTAARLKSPHAVRVSDAGTLPNGAPYLVMEHLQGRDLEQELDARGPLPAAEAAAYVMQACEVLGEAHALGIVHRDIKSANLFLTRLPNGAPCIKVLDFGIALQADSLTGQRMTKTTAVFGTPLYMSPEQMKSAKLVDARSDIWSLGVVLYELCMGGVPFDATTMPELVTRVLTETPSFPPALRPGMSREIEPIILCCLERDPARRYPSAAALAQALAPIAAGAAAAPPVGAPGQADPRPYSADVSPRAAPTHAPGSPPFPAAFTQGPGQPTAASPFAPGPPTARSLTQGTPQPTVQSPHQQGSHAGQSGYQQGPHAGQSGHQQGPHAAQPYPMPAPAAMAPHHGATPYPQGAPAPPRRSSSTTILVVVGIAGLLGLVFLVGLIVLVSAVGDSGAGADLPEDPPAPVEE